MRKLIKALIAFLAMWVTVVICYAAATHAKTVLEENNVHWTFKAPLYGVALPIGLASDFLTNVVIGTAVWGEVPQEILFTKRATRHLESDGRDYERAVWWCTQLHYWDHGHCGGWVPSDVPETTSTD